jgi:hypothetical protein
MKYGSLGFRVVFVAGASPPHSHKELSFLDLAHFERAAFKKTKNFWCSLFSKREQKELDHTKYERL